MRLLLTGFEPFGGEAQNPSGRVLAVLRAGCPHGMDGVYWELLLLPVRRELAFTRLRERWDQGSFDVWLGLGQAGGRTRVCAERCARNLFRSAGVAGEPPGDAGELLIEGAPALQVCRWPAAALVADLARDALPIALSDSAGAFVCNELLFRMEHRLCAQPDSVSAKHGFAARSSAMHAERLAMWAGFLHLPYLPEQLADKPPETPALPLEAQVEVVQRSIEWLRAARAATSSQAGDCKRDGSDLAERH